MDRALFTGGPGTLTWNGTTWQMHDDWTAKLNLSHFDVKTNLQGLVGRAIQDTVAKITFTPIAFGGSIASLFTKLFPYQPGQRGQLIFGTTDKPVVIQTAAGKSITFTAAALTKMPDITFAPDKILFGPAELTCLIGNGAEPSDSDAFFSIADSAYVEPSLNPLDILFDLYTISYGINPAAPFDAIETDEAGVKFMPAVQLKERRTASRGIYNYMIDGVTADVKFVPENIAEADWATFITMQGTGYGRGKLRGAFGDWLHLAGSASGKPSLTLPLAAAEAGDLRFGSDSRVAEMTLQGHRRYSSELSCTTVNTSTALTVVPGTAGLAVGMGVSGAGIPGGTTIAAIVDATHVTLSAAATAAGTVNLTFTGLHPLYALGTV
jgi:hypothetical protein